MVYTSGHCQADPNNRSVPRNEDHHANGSELSKGKLEIGKNYIIIS